MFLIVLLHSMEIFHLGVGERQGQHQSASGFMIRKASGKGDATPTFSFPPLRARKRSFRHPENAERFHEVGKENVDEKKMLREADTFWSSFLEW